MSKEIINEFFNKYYERLFKIASRRTCNTDDTHDILFEIVKVLNKKVGLLKKDEEIIFYFCIVAINNIFLGIYEDNKKFRERINNLEISLATFLSNDLEDPEKIVIKKEFKLIINNIKNKFLENEINKNELNIYTKIFEALEKNKALNKSELSKNQNITRFSLNRRIEKIEKYFIFELRKREITIEDINSYDIICKLSFKKDLLFPKAENICK